MVNSESGIAVPFWLERGIPQRRALTGLTGQTTGKKERSGNRTNMCEVQDALQMSGYSLERKVIRAATSRLKDVVVRAFQTNMNSRTLDY